MSQEIKKGQLFVKEVLNRLAGNSDEATANRIGRKAISAITGQIQSLKSKQVEDEIKLEEAQEKLQDAIYPTVVFSDNKAYCEGIVRAQGNVDYYQQQLESTESSIKYFEDLLEKF